MLLMKFGGTSVANTSRIRAVAEITAHQIRQGQQVVLVVSAMGGVTDSLIRAARLAADGQREQAQDIVQELRQRHRNTATELTGGKIAPENLKTLLRPLAEVEHFLDGLCVTRELTRRGLDRAASVGERLSVPLIAAALRGLDLPAQAVETVGLVVTDDQFGAARPDMPVTFERLRAALQPLLEQGITPVVTGYIGSTPERIVTTLGRSGSDYSAAIVGAALGVDEVWIWTDVDGILTADPHIVPNARTLEVLSYVEAAELAYFGAEVLHPKTIAPLVSQRIPLRILNAFRPEHPGTLIVEKPERPNGGPAAIISTRGLSLLTVGGERENWTPQTSARVLSLLSEAGIELLMFSQSFSERRLSLVMRSGDLEPATRLVAHELDRHAPGANGTIGPVHIAGQEAVGSVAVVSRDGSDRLVPRAFEVLGRARLPVLSIAQSASEYHLSVVVPEDALEDTVRAIHEELIA